VFVQERGDGAVDSRLHIQRRLRAEDFRQYSIIAENSVGTADKDVPLYRSMIFTGLSPPQLL